MGDGPELPLEDRYFDEVGKSRHTTPATPDGSASNCSTSHAVT
jgi:hypothetical protein